MNDKIATSLLYLNGVTVSFDGFKALNNLSLAVEPGEMRAIIGPNGAGKTTMMDVITGKTRPDAGDVFFDGTADLTKLDETADRRARHRPQVPEADRVRDAHGRGQYPAGAQERPPRARHAVLARDRRDRHAASTASCEIVRLQAGARARRRQPVARPEAMAGDRHAAGAGAEAAAGRRAGRRHDRRRDAADRRAAARRSTATRPSSWSSTT